MPTKNKKKGQVSRYTYAATMIASARFVTEGTGKENPWKELRGQIYLGSERFVEQMQARVGPDRLLEGVPLRQRRPPAKPLAYYAEHYKDRDQAMAEAHRSGAYSMREIGVYFGVGRMTLSRAVMRHEILYNKANVL